VWGVGGGGGGVFNRASALLRRAFCVVQAPRPKSRRPWGVGVWGVCGGVGGDQGGGSGGGGGGLGRPHPHPVSTRGFLRTAVPPCACARPTRFSGLCVPQRGLGGCKGPGRCSKAF
jgi:hypothetical protein